MKPEDEGDLKTMKPGERGRLKTIIDRERLMRLKTCPACGMMFNLGDPVVLACGNWEGPPQLIHEGDAVFDAQTGSYFERSCYQAKMQG